MKLAALTRSTEIKVTLSIEIAIRGLRRGAGTVAGAARSRCAGSRRGG